MFDVTFFALPKPFKKDLEAIQITAIKSWLPFGKVVLCGDEYGTREIAKEFNVERVDIEDITIKSLIESSEKVIDTKYSARINCDCVLLGGIDNIPEFGDGCVTALRIEYPYVVNMETIHQEYKNYPFYSHTGMDIQIFPKGFYQNVPRIRMGMGGDDNWLAKYALKNGKLIHSKDIVLIHQNHSREYLRVPSTPGWKENQEVYFAAGGGVNLDSANYIIENGKLINVR